MRWQWAIQYLVTVAVLLGAYLISHSVWSELYLVGGMTFANVWPVERFRRPRPGTRYRNDPPPPRGMGGTGL